MKLIKIRSLKHTSFEAFIDSYYINPTQITFIKLEPPHIVISMSDGRIFNCVEVLDENNKPLYKWPDIMTYITDDSRVFKPIKKGEKK